MLHILSKSLWMIFFYCSRMEANCSKSVTLVAGVHTSFQNGVVDMFGYPLGSLPLKHLGVPLISSNLSSTDCKCLVDKILSRIKSWTNRFLFFVGRLRLITSVLYSMQNFWADIFIFPKKVIKAVEQLIRRFLWSGLDLISNGAKVAWADIASPKEEGGLGLRRLEDINLATMMARHIWNLCLPGSSSTWVNWVRVYLIREHYFGICLFLRTVHEHGGSFLV